MAGEQASAEDTREPEASTREGVGARAPEESGRLGTQQSHATV